MAAQSPPYQKTSPKTAPNIFPTSQYLQDRLEERRARNARPRRARQSDAGPQVTTGRDDDIFTVEGDDSHAHLPRTHSSTSSRYDGPSRSRTTGARQLDEQLDRLTKQNFDLKLEVDHRRAHQVKLEDEIKCMRLTAERAEQLVEEHAELLRINSELVEELEKRDKAMQEAVEIICDLEERVDGLEDDKQSVTRASTIHADSGYAGTETLDAAPSSSPVKPVKKRLALAKLASPSVASRNLNKALNSSPIKSRREPAFVKQDDGSTTALRAVYHESNRQLRPIKSFHSILSRHASTIDDDASQYEVLNSPRLSNLSESSFPSIYSPRKISPARHTWEPEDDTVQPSTGLGLHTRQDSISRVSQWIEGYDVMGGAPEHRLQVDAPLPTRSPMAANLPDRFQSLNVALSGADTSREPLLPFRPHTALADSRRSSRTPTSFGGPIFGEPLVSPSPDSVAQRMLRASHSTIVDEKSPSHIQATQSKPLDADLRTAPKQMRSSIELNTAFITNLEYRKTGLSQMQPVRGHSSSPEDESPVSVRDLGSKQCGYPDGGSILMSKTSQFRHDTPSSSRESSGKASVSQAGPRPVLSRQSSSGATGDSRKPHLVRAGTSPNVLPSLSTAGMTSRPKTSSSSEVVSPVSYYSTSSSNRTVFGTSNRLPPAEPRSPPRSTSTRAQDRVPASPRPSLSQKTQLLIRRLSGSHGSDREHYISPSPSRPSLPTLTSTPSSAYVNVIPKELRRANSNFAADTPRPSPKINVQTPTPSRTRTTSEARHATPTNDTSSEKRGFFGRRGSFKQMTGLDRSKTTTPTGRGRRRSSVREAITSGKIWA